MANRIIARFSAQEVDALGRERFLKLVPMMLPALNALAGEEVHVHSVEGLDVLVLASVARPRTFADDLQSGYRRPVRYRRGETMSVWASKTNECAHRLDSIALPPEAVSVLRELFEEIGKQARDAEAFA